MNAPFVPELSPSIEWDSAIDLVDTWRGRCLQLFGRVERAVGETLIHLTSGKPVCAAALPRLVGQKVAELERLLGASEAAPAPKALAALRTFRNHDALRSYLCHGTTSVMLDQHGEWHVVLRMLAFRNGNAVRDERLLSRPEADVCYEALHQEGQRLVSHLTTLRAA